MGKRSQVKDWLKNDEAQRAWAIHYLSVRGWGGVATNLKFDYESGVAALEGFGRTLEGEPVIRTMRGTWRKTVNNKKGKRPTFSYTLPRDSDRELDRLARLLKQSKSVTLEQLITRGFNFEQEERKTRKAALDEERKAWKLRKPLPIPTLLERRLSQKVTALERETAKRQELLSAWLLRYAEREVLLGRPPANVRLDRSQEEAVLRLHTSLLAYHDAKLKIALEAEETPYGISDLSDVPAASNTGPEQEPPLEVASTAADGVAALTNDQPSASIADSIPPNGDRTETESTNFDQQKSSPPANES